MPVTFESETDTAEFRRSRWKEWNGRFRDDVRSFFCGEQGVVTRFSDRILGSPEMYAHKQRGIEQSVNFVTCHDGFTLNDIVSYDQKHNEANLEGNRDGSNDNRSWNCGVEGPHSRPGSGALAESTSEELSRRDHAFTGHADNLMGDEIRRIQHGNNNAYCYDDANNWMTGACWRSTPTYIVSQDCSSRGACCEA